MLTMLQAAALPIPDRVQGQGRLKEIRDLDLCWKVPVFLENITQNDVEGKPAVERTVRTPVWKLILRDHPRDELCNLKSDPGEKNDLLHDPGEKTHIRDLASLIRDWDGKTKDPVAIQFAGRYL